MCNKITKIILISILIVILLLLLIYTAVFDVMTITGRGKEYIRNYKEYIFHIKTRRAFIDFGEGSNTTYRVWFLPGQKEKVLSKIKEDIIQELDTKINENKDLLKEYKISDDFGKIYIYYYPQNISKDSETTSFFVLQNRLNEGAASRLIALYHQLIHGGENPPNQTDNIEYIAVE